MLDAVDLDALERGAKNNNYADHSHCEGFHPECEACQAWLTYESALIQRVRHVEEELLVHQEAAAETCACTHDGRGGLVIECQAHQEIREERDRLTERVRVQEAAGVLQARELMYERHLRTCHEPAPDRSGRVCDKPKGHADPHWTYGGNTLTWVTDPVDLDALERLAEQIADDLFVNGNDERAERLVLTVDGPPRRELGGWCRGVVVDRIATWLRQEQP